MTFSFLSVKKLVSQLSVKCFTQRHNGEVFATELAGNGDFLPQGPASLGNHMMGSCRGVMAHLDSNKENIGV